MLAATILFACNSNKGTEKQFEISGKIANSTARMVYLEELPAGSDEAIIADSSVLGKDGTYKLTAQPEESVVFSLRLDQDMYSIAYVINDASSIVMNVELNKENNHFADKYEIRGSPASQAMKDFIAGYSADLQKIFVISRQADSLRLANAPDSLITPLVAEWTVLAGKVRNYTLSAMKKANDPALIIFELGYYQATHPGFGLERLSPEQEREIINDLIARFPSHQGVKAVKNNFEERLAEEKKREEMKSRWVGKAAPDFSLPDVNGKGVTLSSFKGKYVLVDFWASWCAPCRAENPNVVRAYNRFKDKNFTVLGVSLDRPGQKDKWLAAIRADGLTWTHVSDLKFWNSSVIPLYEFGEIPYNVLVDPQGVVIAENLRGQGLEAKLDEVLK